MSSDPILNKGSIFQTDFFLITRRAYVGDLLEYQAWGPVNASADDERWLIKKFIYSGTKCVSETFAGGSTLFDKQWSNRKNYSYS
jgi:hypothetical protein